MANGEQGNERALFFGTLSATAVALVLLIAPSAWHRIHFPQKDKERVCSSHPTRSRSQGWRSWPLPWSER